MKTLAFCILAIILISCKGETGPTGPQWNANVKTRVYNIQASDYSLNSGIYTTQKNCDLITQDIVSTGTVLVYHKMTDTWFQYPMTLTYDFTKGYTYSFYFAYALNQISFLVIDSSPYTSSLPNGAIGSFKVIVISGNLGMIKYIDKSNYENVKSALNLTD